MNAKQVKHDFLEYSFNDIEQAKKFVESKREDGIEKNTVFNY
mgnify:CR=1 FL=1